MAQTDSHKYSKQPIQRTDDIDRPWRLFFVMISGMKTQRTGMSIETFLDSVSDKRRDESHVLIKMMQSISGEKPYMWGPSIIAFGTTHYKYDSGHEGDMPLLAFSPRKASLTVYFEGFDQYGDLLAKLGKHKLSKACLYINKLDDIEVDVLRTMLEKSFAASTQSNPIQKVHSN